MSGHLIIISSPSGGGKDAVIRGLIHKLPDAVKLMTTTTRPPRPGEQNGVDYNFVTRDEFEKMLRDGKMIEYNFYAENYYGTERQRLTDLLDKHNIVFSNIEVNGKKNLDAAGWNNLSIFLMPESEEVLKIRIETRGGLTPEKIKQRLETAISEVAESKIYDYKIVNYQDKLAETIEKAEEIINERLGLDTNQ
ncbi:MAG: guanylate kinase [Patescibacteria group bacterium]